MVVFYSHCTVRDCENRRNLSVCFDEKLSFKEHIHAKINNEYMMLGTIKRNFEYLTIPTIMVSSSRTLVVPVD